MDIIASTSDVKKRKPQNFHLFSRISKAILLRPKIEHLILYPTGRCNLKCSHCFAYKLREDEGISFEEIKKIAETIPGPIWLEIGGGEPFLRKDLVEICNLFDAERITIPTNGWLTEEIFRAANQFATQKPGKIMIVISLEGFSETHDAIRGKGSFDRAIKTFSRIKDIEGIRVGFTTTLSEKNSDEILDFIKEMKKYKPDFHGVILLRGESFDSKFSLPPLKKLYRVEKELSEIIREGKYGGGLRALIEKNFVSYRRYIAFKTLKEKRQIIPCLAGARHLVIFSNGNVHPCELLPAVGNIKKDSLPEIIKSENLKQSIKKIRSGACHCTHECNMLENILFNPLCYFNLLKRKKW